MLKIYNELTVFILCHFKFQTMINTIVGAGAASRYGSDQMMRLRLRNTGKITNILFFLQQLHIRFAKKEFFTQFSVVRVDLFTLTIAQTETKEPLWSRLSQILIMEGILNFWTVNMILR
jgi:hypothetical protein